MGKRMRAEGEVGVDGDGLGGRGAVEGVRVNEGRLGVSRFDDDAT